MTTHAFQACVFVEKYKTLPLFARALRDLQNGSVKLFVDRLAWLDYNEQHVTLIEQRAGAVEH